MAVIAPPENLQSQSPLLRLPAEIKHIIYGLCFTNKSPVIIERLKGQRGIMPCGTPGASLLRTCRRIYHEADRRPLFRRNIFRFSDPEVIHGFLLGLPVEYRTQVQNIELDMRNLDSDRGHITRGWLQYLAKTGNKTVNSLRIDAAGLKCIRINLEAWPVIPMPRIELWNVLRSMLSELKHLETIVVTGASRGRAMDQRSPCSPVHFVGGDDVGTNDLLFRMDQCVFGHQNDDKIIKWTRKDGKIELGVCSRHNLPEGMNKQGSGSSGTQNQAGVWPLNGCCTISAYDTFPSMGIEVANK